MTRARAPSASDGGTLHVLASPFPSPQGTQGAVRSMVQVEREAGRDTRLLAYAEGREDSALVGVVGRAARLPWRVGERSGPSVARIAHDAALAAALLGRRDRRVVAHHVEAALACIASRTPYVFVAHADFEDELPRYPSFGGTPRAASVLGRTLDATVARCAVAVGGISEVLVARFRTLTSRPVLPLPIPWRVPSAEPPSRAVARAALGLPPDATVWLYAGNLDPYQELGRMFAAAEVHARQRPTWMLLASECEDPVDCPVPLRRTRLRDEADRALVHAAADVTVLSRTMRGGFPVKLLEAAARGVPAVATAECLQGAEAADAFLVSEPDAVSLAGAAERAMAERDRRVRAAREHVRVAHAPERYLAALDRLAAFASVG